MGLPGRLGNPIAAVRIEDDLARPWKTHPMTGGDIDWCDPVLGPQNDPHLFAFVEQRPEAPAFPRRLPIFADQQALGAAN